MKKMKFSLILAFCFYSINVFSQLQIGTNVIPNGSFENGMTPTNIAEHNLPINSIPSNVLDNWTTGYTANTCFSWSSSICYGGVQSGTSSSRANNVILFDYNSTANCRYNAPPNSISSTITNTQPQQGNRFIYIQGGFQNIPNLPVFEGGSISTEFENLPFLCDGTYELNFWAKAPDHFLQMINCPLPSGTNQGFNSIFNSMLHPENKIEVVLRQSTNFSLETILFTTPKILVGSWQFYSVNLNLSSIQMYDRIEFRIKKQGNGGSIKEVLIDNVGLFYTDYPAHIVLSHSTSITCGEIADLDGIAGTCSNPGEWTINGNPIAYPIMPSTTTTYSRICYDGNGCFESKEEVIVYVNTPLIDTVQINLCHDNLYSLPPSNCQEGGFTSWTFPDGSVQSSIQADGGMYLTQEGTYQVNNTYNNGCECTTVIQVTHTNYVTETKDVTACFGSDVTLEFNPFLNITNHTFTWNGVPGNSTQTITANGFETIVGKAFNSNGCMTQEVIYNIIVNLYQQIVKQDTVRCNNCIDIIADACPVYSVSGYWSHDSSRIASKNICPKKNETYTYSCYDANGCITQQNVFEIVYETPITTISLDIPEVVACSLNNAKPPIKCSNGAYYKWYDENGNFIIETNEPELPMQANGVFDNSGRWKGKNYTVEVYDRYGCLKCIETFNITWFNNDRRYFIDGDVIAVCAGKCAKLDFINVSGAQRLSFNWSLPGSPVSGTDIKNITDTTFEFCPPTFPVTLTLQYVDPNDPTCLVFYQKVTVIRKEPCFWRKAAPLKTEDIELEDDAIIYPNPSNGSFMLSLTSIDLSNSTYSITDATGRLIREETNIKTENTEIMLDDIKKGVYLINIKRNDSMIVKKILIE